MNKFEDLWSNSVQSTCSSLKDLEDADFVKKKIESYFWNTKNKKDPSKGLIKKNERRLPL